MKMYDEMDFEFDFGRGGFIELCASLTLSSMRLWSKRISSWQLAAWNNAQRMDNGWFRINRMYR